MRFLEVLALLRVEQAIELAPLAVLHDEVEVRSRLDHPMQRGQERVVHLLTLEAIASAGVSLFLLLLNCLTSEELGVPVMQSLQCFPLPLQRPEALKGKSLLEECFPNFYTIPQQTMLHTVHFLILLI